MLSFQKRRLERLARGATGFTTDIFSECGNIFVTDQTKPPHHHLVALIKLAGGQVMYLYLPESHSFINECIAVYFD